LNFFVLSGYFGPDTPFFLRVFIPKKKLAPQCLFSSIGFVPPSPDLLRLFFVLVSQTFLDYHIFCPCLPPGDFQPSRPLVPSPPTKTICGNARTWLLSRFFFLHPPGSSLRCFFLITEVLLDHTPPLSTHFQAVYPSWFFFLPPPHGWAVVTHYLSFFLKPQLLWLSTPLFIGPNFEPRSIFLVRSPLYSTSPFFFSGLCVFFWRSPPFCPVWFAPQELPSF